MPRHLIIRTLFKPRPFEWPRACTDTWTSGVYVDIMAPEIDRALGIFISGRVSGILNIGTGRKSIYDLARLSRDVTQIERRDLDVHLPRDTSLNLERWRASVITHNKLYAYAVFGDEEKRAVADALDIGRLGPGALVAKFETRIASRFGKRHRGTSPVTRPTAVG